MTLNAYYLLIKGDDDVTVFWRLIIELLFDVPDAAAEYDNFVTTLILIVCCEMVLLNKLALGAKIFYMLVTFYNSIIYFLLYLF